MTDYTTSVGQILVIEKQRVGQENSVGPKHYEGETKSLHLQSRWDRSLISVRPKRYEGKQRVCIAISVGPIAHLGWTKMLRREIERLQSHLGETEIPFGETEKTRVCGSGYVKQDFKSRPI